MGKQGLILKVRWDFFIPIFGLYVWCKSGTRNCFLYFWYFILFSWNEINLLITWFGDRAKLYGLEPWLPDVIHLRPYFAWFFSRMWLSSVESSLGTSSCCWCSWFCFVTLLRLLRRGTSLWHKTGGHKRLNKPRFVAVFFAQLFNIRFDAQ